MSIRYQQARGAIISCNFLFYRMVLHGEAPRQKLLKVTFMNRAVEE